MRANSLALAVLLIFLSILLSSQLNAQIAPAAVRPTPGPALISVSGMQKTTLQARAALPRSRTYSTQALTSTLYTEDFEAPWPHTLWAVFDNNNINQPQYLWSRRACQPFSGTYSGMAAGGGSQGANRSCSSNYANNIDTWAVYGPIDLSNASSANLTFFVRGKTEGTFNNPIDYLLIASGTDDVNFTGSGAVGGDLTNGPFANQYYGFTVDFGPNGAVNRLGQSQVWIAFIFQSDKSRTDLGLTIDDIQLDIQYNPPTPTFTPTSTATSTPTPTSTATSISIPSPTAVAPPPTSTPIQLQNPHTLLPMLIYTFAPADCPGTGANTSATQSAAVTPDSRPCRGAFRSQAEGTSQWYSAAVGAGQTITVDLTDIPSGADYDIYLFDAQVLTSSTAQYVALSNKNNNADEQLTFRSQAAARYYLRVVLATKTNAAPNSYLLAVADH